MSDSSGISYTTEEIANLLKISKLTVYDLIKKGDLPAYRVGRQMRVDASDLEAYKVKMKGSKQLHVPPAHAAIPATAVSYPEQKEGGLKNLVITGQDIALDLLAHTLEGRTKAYRPLRSYAGSMDSLIAMYREETDIVSCHLLDGDTGEYNIPYIRHVLVGHSILVIRLLSRKAGIYVQKGNPKNIQGWKDLAKPGLRFVNREKGSGARVLLDEQLRLHGIPKSKLVGYDQVETSHFSVAGQISEGQADVGIGTEKAAHLVNVDFIPLIDERYDLVVRKEPRNQEWITLLTEVIQSDAFKQKLRSIQGYDLSETGTIIYES